ncbi:hypothetical protein [Conyzicola sp.]|uniref:hypothetical protein n=1 Tax=Conyzicola sp. TaxID=1969404 RepID=UPI0039896C2A
MSSLDPDATPDTVAPARPTLTQRLKQSEAERERLQREVDQLSTIALSKWLLVAHHQQSHAAITQTLSWRITRPLRTARQVQMKISEVGVAGTAQVVVATLRKRRQR